MKHGRTVQEFSVSGTLNVCPVGMYLGCFWDEQVPHILSSFILYLICSTGICFADYTGMEQVCPSWHNSIFLLFGTNFFNSVFRDLMLLRTLLTCE